MHFQKAGHFPIVLLGGATGMIGDPSGKSDERNLLDQETLEKNCNGMQKQFEKFLDFDKTIENPALMINNFDWMKSFSLIDFSRDIGKHLTVNYMMAKESVKKRLDSESSVGMSFTEFTYQLIQGYDFLHLYKTEGCKLQMGGSDQWGNITTGMELIRRIDSQKGYALTCPLITKSDGSKFGKSEGGNIWLDSNKTSVYKFYQYWLNTSDEDAKNYIKIFTFLDQNSIEKIISDHEIEPHLRLLQKTLASEVTMMVHSKKELENAIKASTVLFSKNFLSDINKVDESLFLDIFEGVEMSEIDINEFNSGIEIIKLLHEKSGFLASSSEARRSLSENSIAVNKVKVDQNYLVSKKDFIKNKYVVINRGKKKTFIIKAV